MGLKKTLADMVSRLKGAVPEVDNEGLERAARERNPIVIDVREPDERARGVIPGSIHIPRGVLERDIERKAFGGEVHNDDLNRPIICYCGGGSRSLLAARSLQEMGFSNVSSLAGGFAGWKESGRPVEEGQ